MMRGFWIGVLVGTVIGAAGAMIYCELSSAPDEVLIFRTPDDPQ
jgi:gas vesicle protein